MPAVPASAIPGERVVRRPSLLVSALVEARAWLRAPLVAALTASGLVNDESPFHRFPCRTYTASDGQYLESLKSFDGTLVLYESPVSDRKAAR